MRSNMIKKTLRISAYILSADIVICGISDWKHGFETKAAPEIETEIETKFKNFCQGQLSVLLDGNHGKGGISFDHDFKLVFLYDTDKTKLGEVKKRTALLNSFKQADKGGISQYTIISLAKYDKRMFKFALDYIGKRKDFAALRGPMYADMYQVEGHTPVDCPSVSDERVKLKGLESLSQKWRVCSTVTEKYYREYLKNSIRMVFFENWIRRNCEIRPFDIGSFETGLEIGNVEIGFGYFDCGSSDFGSFIDWYTLTFDEEFRFKYIYAIIGFAAGISRDV